ncbi:hypothetical protein RND71_016085 [Anisodus tanguticus]|uniref:START domain-containing protein n=1 Tax=Anisodus tanguticus TaxID=243964 RepID=A0AAE1S893_9SOLA|nr:hypothetical protein RND71_016085 [Anisodus tanguticus]
MSMVMYEGWMVRYGRRKIGKSYSHMRYFVLETRLLAYYKKKPQDNVVPVRTLLIDGNCRVEDRGLKTQHGHMAAFNIQEALIWKEKIELVIDQIHKVLVVISTFPFEYKSGMDSDRNGSSSDRESQFSAGEDEDDSHANLLRRTTIGDGLPESVVDWTKELDSDLSNQNASNQAFSRKYWRLLQYQTVCGFDQVSLPVNMFVLQLLESMFSLLIFWVIWLRIFEELLDANFLPKSCSRAMKAVGVVDTSCEEIFELVMSMDAIRFEWDCSFQYGSLVEEFGYISFSRKLSCVEQLNANELVSGSQTGWLAVCAASRSLYKLLLPMHVSIQKRFVWPRDLCYVRYWRRNDDGSYVVLFRSREHENCGPVPGYVRAHIERLHEYFSQTDERAAAPRIPVMVNMTSASISSKKTQNEQETSHQRTASLDLIHAANRNASMIDEFSDEDEDFQGADHGVIPPSSENEMKKTALEEPLEQIDLSIFSGNLQRDDNDNGRNCWKVSDGNNFRVRSRNFCYDKSKTPAGKHLMDLVAVDWFKDTKRMDHVARLPGCAAQVHRKIFGLGKDGKGAAKGRMSRSDGGSLGSWIVRQSVGSTPCLLGKAVDCNYIRGPTYLEVDIDIGSSTVANGVLGLVIGVITTLVVDMAFLVQANTPDELPERLIGAVRVSHAELSSAIVPKLEPDTPS